MELSAGWIGFVFYWKSRRVLSVAAERPLPGPSNPYY